MGMETDPRSGGNDSSCNERTGLETESCTGGNDSVCFTAGYKGAAFAAGVIHAHLAADRKAPLVVSGISMGAVNAAALRRCYQELAAAPPDDREVARWAWYRKYLRTLTQRPLQPIWDSIPDLEDFFTKRYPIWDRSTPDHLAKSEAEKVRRRYLMTQLGRWLGRSRLSVAAVARLVVARVRFLEKYDTSRARRFAIYCWCGLRVYTLILWHVVRHPTWINEDRLKKYVNYQTERWGRRPLFGWRVYLLSTIALAILFLPTGAVLHALATTPGWSEAAKLFGYALLVWVGGICAVVTLLTWRRLAGVRRRARRSILELVGVERGIVPDFHVRRRLFELFGDDLVDLNQSDESADLATSKVPRLQWFPNNRLRSNLLSVRNLRTSGPRLDQPGFELPCSTGSYVS